MGMGIVVGPTRLSWPWQLASGHITCFNDRISITLEPRALYRIISLIFHNVSSSYLEFSIAFHCCPATTCGDRKGKVSDKKWKWFKLKLICTKNEINITVYKWTVVCGALGDCGVGHASVPECAAAVCWLVPVAVPRCCWRLYGAVCLCEVEWILQHCGL